MSGDDDRGDDDPSVVTDKIMKLSAAINGVIDLCAEEAIGIVIIALADVISTLAKGSDDPETVLNETIKTARNFFYEKDR